ncbi:hypothetical protein ENU1_085490 [Entamoeba nuttalli P19]|uniref:TLDc domain-containing protein n=2 Tax=Entamoeba nuttalli TaxID=412467 RepID=K2GZJ0_ENTNP|nr:hypothetical protein ENU1_085490 [Entamoeba nuttalli P19]EKE40613.1 hypothetical protein ENU1_085490 [Entamoeba nuttalli P19]|eukprot:XP_008857055.1 hypothetical protein ENU1_085490 [Entamoeba nuttalli P19]
MMEVIKDTLKEMKKAIDQMSGDEIIESFAKSAYNILIQISNTIYGKDIKKENIDNNLKECHLINSFENTLQLNELFYLKEWTGQHEFRILYDTDQQPFLQEYIQFTVIGRKNLVLLFETTKNALFGCYLEAPIYINEYGFAEDFDTFVFSLRSPKLPKPTKFGKLRSFGDLCHFSISFKADKQCIINVDGAFSIMFPLNEVVSEVNPNFKVNFKNALDSLLLGDDIDFALKRMFILDSY